MREVAARSGETSRRAHDADRADAGYQKNHTYRRLHKFLHGLPSADLLLDDVSNSSPVNPGAPNIRERRLFCGWARWATAAAAANSPRMGYHAEGDGGLALRRPGTYAPSCAIPSTCPDPGSGGYHEGIIELLLQDTMSFPRARRAVPEGVLQMASNVRKIVEPAMGWLFVVAVIVALGAALLAATRPRTDMGRRVDVQRSN